MKMVLLKGGDSFWSSILFLDLAVVWLYFLSQLLSVESHRHIDWKNVKDSTQNEKCLNCRFTTCFTRKEGDGAIEYPNRIEQNVRNTSKTNSNSMTTRKIGILYHFRNGMYVKRKCESHSVGIDWNWLQQPHWAAVCPWFGLATPLFPSSSSSSSCPYLHTGVDQSLTSHCPRFHNYISMRHKHGKTAQMVAKVQQYTRLCFYYSCLHRQVDQSQYFFAMYHCTAV